MKKTKWGLLAPILAAVLMLIPLAAKAGTVAYSLAFGSGWTLAGNSQTTALDVRKTFGQQWAVQTVWKWNAATVKWAFYAPSLDAAGTLAAYAAANGYDALTTVNPGEGYWLNASAPVALGTSSGTGLNLSANDLSLGWNLVATGEDIGAAAFAARAVTLASIWAWDNSNAAWYFYAASLDAQNALATYNAGKGYRDFGTLSLGQGRGFWVANAGTPVAFTGTVVLGAPTDHSIKASVFSENQGGTVYLAYGTAPGSYDAQTAPVALVAGQPLQIDITGLARDTRHCYRLYYQPGGASTFWQGAEHGFHTARSSESSFTFTVQADSHMDGNSSLDQYRNTLANVLADGADFHIDLGDTFMTEKFSQPLTSVSVMAPDQATVNARYVYERGNFGSFAHSVPLFLVNGNHDGELGWLTNGTAQVLPVWATQARHSYFVNPVPDAFYTGDSYTEPFVGERASWYAWTWGDALFVALDPYWSSKVQASKDGWNLTLGERQYRWLATTLASSSARYKFVFIHNLVGGLDGQMRGGIEAAPYFEWGGKNLDGSDGFATQRPGWGLPIHQLLVQNGVTAVFHGHDHLYAKQSLDGIVYQEVPQPSALNTSNGPLLSLIYHYASGTILSSAGHLRVTVAPSGVTSEYVRSWLPQNVNTGQANRQVDDRWTVAPR